MTEWEGDREILCFPLLHLFLLADPAWSTLLLVPIVLWRHRTLLNLLNTCRGFLCPARSFLPAPHHAPAPASLIFALFFDHTKMIPTSKQPSFPITLASSHVTGLTSDCFSSKRLSPTVPAEMAAKCRSPSPALAPDRKDSPTPTPQTFCRSQKKPTHHVTQEVMSCSLQWVPVGLPTQQTFSFILVIMLSMFFGEHGHPHPALAV